MGHEPIQMEEIAGFEPKIRFQILRGNECVGNKHLLSFREIAKNTHVYLKRLFKHSKLLKMLRFPLSLPSTRRGRPRLMQKLAGRPAVLPAPDARGPQPRVHPHTRLSGFFWRGVIFH